MGRRVPLPLGLKVGKGASSLVSSENVINMYPEVKDGRPHLVGIPGQVDFSATSGAQRGQFEAGGTHFVLRGSTLSTVSTAGVATSVGTIAGSGRVQFAYNGTYLHIVSDTTSYNYNIGTGVLTQITDVDFEAANSVAVIANIPVYARLNTGQIAWPSLTDVFAFDGLDFAEAETSPDNIKGLLESAQELLIFSEHSVEPWRFTGNPDQYFEASTAAAAIDDGALCRDAILNVDKAPIWLAHKKSGGLYVARLESYNAVRISNHAVETSIEKAANPEDAFAETMSWRGHEFYVLTIPDHVTWVYDAATQEWSQWLAGSWPTTTPEIPQGDWGVRDFAVNSNRKPIVGATDGMLYELSFDSFSANGAGITREFTTPPFTMGGMSFTISEIELICATGVGLPTGTGSTPYVQMSLSFNGGKTWSDPFIEELGPLADYDRGVRFNRLGKCPGSKGVMAKFRTDDAVEFTPVEAFITYALGTR